MTVDNIETENKDIGDKQNSSVLISITPQIINL